MKVASCATPISFALRADNYNMKNRPTPVWLEAGSDPAAMRSWVDSVVLNSERKLVHGENREPAFHIAEHHDFVEYLVDEKKADYIERVKQDCFAIFPKAVGFLFRVNEFHRAAYTTRVTVLVLY